MKNKNKNIFINIFNIILVNAKFFFKNSKILTFFFNEKLDIIILNVSN